MTAPSVTAVPTVSFEVDPDAEPGDDLVAALARLLVEIDAADAAGGDSQEPNH